MTELLPIFFGSLVLAFFSDKCSRKNINTHEYEKKEKFFYTIMALFMICFIGLRTRYNDTFAYLHAYESMKSMNNPFKDISWKIGDNFGFKVVNALLVKAGFSSQSFLMFYAVVTVGIYLWFIRKYSTNILFSIFLFFIIGSYLFALAAIKQCVAVAIGLVAVDRYLNDKKILFVLLILIACTFHPYVLMFLLFPLLRFRPGSNKTMRLVLLFVLLGFILRPLLGTLVSITAMMGESYTAESFSGEGVNVFRVLVTWVPIILTLLIRDNIQDDDEKLFCIINATTLQGAIMFVGLFGTANYFGRLANYFSMFAPISVPWLISKLDKRERDLVTLAAIIGYSLYFIYANAINSSFNYSYDRISLVDYLRYHL